MFLCKNITEISDESLLFWKKVLDLSPDNIFFDNENLDILVKYKWDNFGREYYLRDFIGYLFFFLLYMINFIYLFPDRQFDNQISTFGIVSLIFDFLDAIYFLFYAKYELKQMAVMRVSYFISFWEFVDILVILGVISTVILDIIYILAGEYDFYPVKIMISITMLCLWAKLLSYSRGFQGTGFLIRLVEKVVSDMKFFLLMIFLTMMAFGCAGYILQDSYDHYPFFLFNLVYRLMLGDYTNFDSFVLDNDESFVPLWIGMIFLTIFLSIIMLNLLISIIGGTYGQVSETEKSARTYELLNVIYEIEKYKILNKRDHEKLKESKIIGDYLFCFHNHIHFQKDNQDKKSNLYKVVGSKIEIMEKSNNEFKENMEKNINELKKIMEENSKKIEENSQKNEQNYKKNEQKFDILEKLLKDWKEEAKNNGK